MTLGPLMLDVEGLALTAADRERLGDPLVGAVILFGRNFCSRDQLRELVARIISRPLDRNRPLWEVYFVEGLAKGRVAITTVASPTSATTARSARCRIPSGSDASEPVSSFVDGMPNSMMPPTPAAAASAAARTAEATEC